jgi:hypothetical protein
MNDQRGSIQYARARVVGLFIAMQSSNDKVQPPFNQSKHSSNHINRPTQKSNSG